MVWLQVLSVIATIKKLVGEALHCFLQSDIRLGSIQNLTPIDDIVLYQMFVHEVSDSHLANECMSGDIFAAVVYFGLLALEEANVHLETVGGSHINEKEVMVILLELLVREY